MIILTEKLLRAATMPRAQQTLPAATLHATCSRSAARLGVWCAMRALAAATALVALHVQAQGADPAAPPPAPAASQMETAQAQAHAAPKYTAKDLERAFNFMDANHDGKVSREEAAGFRGVARHFDAADTNKDTLLSREEFEHALNTEKSR